MALPAHRGPGSKQPRHRRLTTLPAFALAVAAGGAWAAGPALPYPDAPFKGKIATTGPASTPDWPQLPKAPAGAPNVVVILLDDLGFGGPATFGGPADSPELDKLADNGLRYNAFNTDAICAPTRASLLTGRNHHQVGFGNLPDVAAGYPGYNVIWNKQTASIAEMLKDNGYSTAAFGKWHNTPEWEISPAGPFDRWPTGLGFEYFYGFMGGENSNWEPRMFRGTNAVENPPTSDFHLTTAITDDAIRWIHNHRAMAPNKPFFVYFATAATHAPHHVPKEWVDKYKGKFDAGWDRISDETFARQKKLGIIPANTVKTPRPAGLPAWDSLTPDQKKVYARQMEVFAAFMSHTDHEVGRLLQDLRDQGIDRNTLVFYVAGDNGPSAEAGLEGSDHEMARYFVGNDPIAEQLARSDDLGSVTYDNHYAAAWAWATATPFQGMKMTASHFGGTRNGLVVSWPGHTSQPQVVRGQFGHVNDVAPTILAAAGIPFPSSVNGVAQLPFEGTSMIPTFTNPKAPETHRTQYFDIFGNRAIYQDGWVAAAKRFEPWQFTTSFPKVFDGDFTRDKWELYNVREDFAEAHDLADKYPDKLKALEAVFDSEAKRNMVYPLAPRPFASVPHIAPPDQIHFDYLWGVDRIPLNAMPALSGRAHRITVEVEAPAQANGVILAFGGRYGGFVIYVKDGKLIYENGSLGLVHEKVISTRPLPAGKVTIATGFTPEAPADGRSVVTAARPAGAAQSGTARLFINGQQVAAGKFSHFGDFGTAINETFDLGRDNGSPVSPDYAGPNPFNGRVDKASFDLGT